MHTYGPDTIKTIILAGCTAIEHGTFIDDVGTERPDSLGKPSRTSAGGSRIW